MASKKQVDWLADLLFDCGFVDRVNRNAYLSEELGRKIRFLDELKPDEASRMINQLREMKDERAGGDRNKRQ